MDTTGKEPAFLHDRNYLDLCAYYLDHPIALYTGAGVSKTPGDKFGVGLWDELVKSILVYAPGDSAAEAAFDKKKARWKDKPWEMAEWVAAQIGVEAFKQRVTALVQKKDNFQERYKLLSVKFLESAITLNSVAAFCGGLAGGKIVKYAQGCLTAVYLRSINPRVEAVVTSNYDPFLEAASSTLFRKPLLKPVAARGSSAGGMAEIPVFHIHGYVPFPYEFRKKEAPIRSPFVDPVITTGDYKAAWKADDVYNFTMGPQIHILRHYAVLFIGFSFRDQWVNRLLMKLNEERRGRPDRLFHYAVMHRAEIEAKSQTSFFSDLGVKPIPWEAPSQIKELLNHLYRQALVHDHPGEAKITLPFYPGRSSRPEDQPVRLTPAEYFEELYHCRLSMVRHGKPAAGSAAG